MTILDLFSNEATYPHIYYALPPHFIFPYHMVWELARVLGVDVQSVLRVRLFALVYFVCVCV